MVEVELSAVSLTYHLPDADIDALKAINLRVPAQQFLALVGPSGCGKSTLLSLVAGLLRATRGEIRLGGRLVTGPSEQVGYMFQQDTLFAWRSVLDNVLLGPQIRRLPEREARNRALNLLTEFGLEGFARVYPGELSGGMRQRVALIRTLMLDPAVMLLDEPFSAVDYQTRLHLQHEVAQVVRRNGSTALLVTHDLTEALVMADRVVVLSPRPGRITTDVTLPFSPEQPPLARRREADFIRYFDILWDAVQEGDEQPWRTTQTSARHAKPTFSP